MNSDLKQFSGTITGISFIFCPNKLKNNDNQSKGTCISDGTTIKYYSANPRLTTLRHLAWHCALCTVSLYFLSNSTSLPLTQCCRCHCCRYVTIMSNTTNRDIVINKSQVRNIIKEKSRKTNKCLWFTLPVQIDIWLWWFSCEDSSFIIILSHNITVVRDNLIFWLL